MDGVELSLSSCWMMLGVATPTNLSSPAAALACSTALSRPSVTKLMFESARGQPSGTLCVTMNVGTPIG
jgi:hypothetical protein